MSWEQRMADRAEQRRMERIRAEQIAWGEEHLFKSEPPDADHCPECWEWRVDDPRINRHAWFLTCSRKACQHECHEGEVWFALIGETPDPHNPVRAVG